MIRDNDAPERALPRWGARAVRMGRTLALGVVALAVTGCTDWALYDLDVAWGGIPALGMLRGSVAYDPYELPRLPAPGAVSLETPGREVLPAFTQLQLDSVGAVLVNPLTATPEVLALGQQVYETQCTVCHGPQGAGDGTVVGPGKYPFAPPINGAATAARSDGYMYGVIRVGRGLMPAYGERVHHLERWATVLYLRTLQQGGAAAPAATPAAAPAPAGADAPAAGAVDTLQAAR